MKSYLRFLSRNKLYTAIMAVGLSIALAFVILLGSYVIDQTSYDQGVDTENLYVCHIDFSGLQRLKRKEILANAPEIESVCYFRQINADNGMSRESFKALANEEEHRINGIITEPEFLTMFPLVFLEGDTGTALSEIDNVIISESFAERGFTEGDIIGAELRFAYAGYEDRIFTVSGVFEDMEKSTFKSPDVIFQEKTDLSDGAVEMNSSYIMKMNEGIDGTTLAASLAERLNEGARFQSNLTITPFGKIRGNGNKWFSISFNNTYDEDIISMYKLMCMFIILISMMNYIALTIAFSRFRLKETATRRLLGSGRIGIMFRCFTETLLLLAVSSVFAALIAIALKEPVGSILGVEINPLMNIHEYIFIAGIVIVSSAIAGAIPSMTLSIDRPIEVIKGEEKHREKFILSKVFIFTEGALSILSVAVTMAIFLQTNEMLKRPRGYETDNLTFVSFPVEGNVDRFYYELCRQSYIEAVGMLQEPPMSIDYEALWFNDEAGNEIEVRRLSGDRKGMELLGIKITEEWAKNPVGDFYAYVCQSSIDMFSDIIRDGNIHDYRYEQDFPLCGTVSDFTIGNVKSGTEARLTMIDMISWDDYIPSNAWDNLIIKTTGEEDEACRKIREFYRSKGYDDTKFSAKTFNGIMKEQLKKERQTLFLLIIFTAVCLLLTAMAIIALSSYYAQTNTRNTAVRKVFGISQREVFRKTVWGFTAPVISGAIIAIPPAFLYVDRWLQTYPVRIGNSPAIYLAALSIVLLVTLASVTLQALRLMRTNPADALKKE